MNEERIVPKGQQPTASVSAGLAMTGDKPRTPEMIGAEIRMYVDAGRRITLLCGIEIGRRLVEAKEMLNHGEWLPWLKRETDFSERSAQNYMKVFNTYGAAQLGLFGPETNTQTFADLPISKALALLSLPESERETFAEEVGAETLSVRDLEALVKERTDELRAAKESAEAAARGAAEELREAENAREDAENARAEAEEQLRRIKAELDEIEKRPQATVYERDEEAIAQAVQAERERLENERESVISKAANDAADAEREKHREEEKKLKAKIAELKEQAKKNDEILRSAQNDMQKAQADAKDAREAAAKAQQAGAEAERLRGDIEVLRKQLSMAAPEVAEFKAAFDRAQDELVHMTDALHRIQDEETRGKLRKACAAMLDGFMGRVKE
ncbi:MAG: DUF3102 domain-containing protein [Bacteroidales bacterium]|nr:DUF3102 domain-containing protein [Bacteroidales bacterium]